MKLTFGLKKQLVWLIAGSSLLFGASLLANDKTDDLMEAMQIEKDLNGISDFIHTGNKAITFQMKSEEAEYYAKIFLTYLSDNINSDELRPYVKSAINTTLSNSEINQMLSWYQSPIGLTLTEKLSGDLSAKDHEQLVVFKNKLKSNELDSELLKKYQWVSDYHNIVEVFSTAFLLNQQALLMGITSELPYESDELTARLSLLNDDTRQGFKQFLAQMLEGYIEYRLSSLSDYELNSYIEQMNWSASKKLRDASYAGMYEAIKMGSYNAGAEATRNIINSLAELEEE